MILVSILNWIIMFIGYYILLGGLKLGDNFLDMLVVGAKFPGCRADGDFILDDVYEL